MSTSRIIFFIDLFIWLLPPLRQKNTKYFIFFLLLALSDPFYYLVNLIHLTDSPPYYLIISALVLISLNKKKYSLFLLPLIAGLLFILGNSGIRFCIFILQFIILLYFLKELILTASEKSKMIIFNLVLVMYQVSVMTKFASSYFFTIGYIFYDLTTAFEILICVFFILYNDKNSPQIKLQMEPR